MRDREAQMLVADVLRRASEPSATRRDELIRGLIASDRELGDRRGAVLAAYEATTSAFRLRPRQRDSVTR